jgi:hypothetical protein
MEETTQPSIDALIEQIRRFPSSITPESAPGPDGMIVHHLGKAYEDQRVCGNDGAFYRAAVSRIWTSIDDQSIRSITLDRGEDDVEYLRQQIEKLVADSRYSAYQARIEAAERAYNTAVVERDMAIMDALRTRTQAEVAELFGLSQQRIGQIYRERKAGVRAD